MSDGSVVVRWARQSSAALVLLLLASGALAQGAAYPVKPVKVFVPSAPGTGIDIVVRMMNEVLSKNLGQPFVVETRPGAASTIAAAGVLGQPADGYTLLSDSSSHTIVPAMMSLSYDTARDFSGVTTMIENPLMMVASRSSGIRSVADLIAAAKAKGGAMNYASAGVGSTTHISAEKFRIGAGLQGVHVPFKSSTDALIEVMAGRIDFIYTALASGQAGIADGKLVALAMGSRRVAAIPNVPSIGEIVPNASYSTWLGIMVSSKTPRDLVTRLNSEIVKAMNSAEVKEKLAKIGAEPWTMTADEFDALRRRELVENERLIKAAGIKM